MYKNLITIFTSTFFLLNFSTHAGGKKECLEKMLNELMKDGPTEILKQVEDPRAMFIRLNPGHTAAEVDQKLASISSQFLFYRSFPNLTSEVIEQAPELKFINKAFSKIKTKGIGDAHIDNYGRKIIGNTVAYGPNDPDRIGIYPIHHDILRYLGSLKSAGKITDEKDLAKYYEHYLKALKNKDFELSKSTQKANKKANKGKLEPAEDEVLGDKLWIKKNPKEPVSNMTVKEKNALAKIMKEHIGGDVKILDAKKFKRAEGGSGGLMRYRMLVELPQEFADQNGLKTIQVMEFKQAPTKLYDPVTKKNIDVTTAFVNQQIHNLYHEETFALYSAVDFNDGTYIMRPRLQELDSKKASKLRPDEIHDTILDQIRAMARTHQYFLQDEYNDYVNALEEFTPEQWGEASDQLEEHTTKLYNHFQ